MKEKHHSASHATSLLNLSSVFNVCSWALGEYKYSLRIGFPSQAKTTIRMTEQGAKERMHIDCIYMKIDASLHGL